MGPLPGPGGWAGTSEVRVRIKNALGILGEGDAPIKQIFQGPYPKQWEKFFHCSPPSQGRVGIRGPGGTPNFNN